MATPTTDQAQKRRAAMRAAQLKPVRLWVIDARRPGFQEECQRQARAAAAADRADPEAMAFLDDAFATLVEDDREAI